MDKKESKIHPLPVPFFSPEDFCRAFDAFDSFLSNLCITQTEKIIMLTEFLTRELIEIREGARQDITKKAIAYIEHFTK